jgi:hypothetical protein
MLKEKTPKAQAVVAIKLVTGEEIMARLVSDEDAHVIVKSPLSMILADNPDAPDQTRVMFTPWMVSAGKETVTIKNTHVVALTTAREDAAAQYNQALGTDEG